MDEDKTLAAARKKARRIYGGSTSHHKAFMNGVRFVLSDDPTGPPEGIAKQIPSAENLEKKNEDPRVVRVYNGCSPTPIAWWTESGGTKE